MKANITINKINFGKTPVATCNVTDKNTKKDSPATIYKMDPFNESDVREIRYSKNTRCLKYGIDIEKRNGPYGRGREFYLLKADKTGEVVACAQTLHRFRTGDVPYQGLSTMVEESSENKKFVNGAFPLFAYIAHHALERNDKSVISIVGTDEDSSLQKKLNMKQTAVNGVFALSNRQFKNFINKAKEKTQLDILL